MHIETAVFHRIHTEARQAGAEEERSAALRALVTTMGETARFGTFTPDVLLEIARARIDAWKEGRGW